MYAAGVGGSESGVISRGDPKSFILIETRVVDKNSPEKGGGMWHCF
jgi:hypothetical protein